MTQPNILELARRQLQNFHWPAWFPYPSSWFRAVILIPIAFPGTRLIVFGFGGTILSFLTNSPTLLIFSVLFGLLIPIIFLAFIYHIFWFVWQKQKSWNCLPKWMPSLISLWSGFYATCVMGLSFLLILSLFSELAFSECKSYYGISDELSGCAGRMTGRAAKVLFYSTENNNFLNKPWFIIWIITAAYLYQAEYLVRHRFIPTLKSTLQNYRSTRKTYIVNQTDLELDRLRSDMGLTQIKKGKNIPSNITSFSERHQLKHPKLGKKLSLIFLVPLVAVGIYFLAKFPEIQETVPLPTFSKTQAPVSSQNTEIVPSPVISKSPTVLAKSDTFREAVNQAISAANLTQSAKSQDEWKVVMSKWQIAIASMKVVPSSSPNYPLAQQKIIEYQQNLKYAQKNTINK
jgi:hypothetical protein